MDTNAGGVGINNTSPARNNIHNINNVHHSPALKLRKHSLKSNIPIITETPHSVLSNNQGIVNNNNNHENPMLATPTQLSSSLSLNTPPSIQRNQPSTKANIQSSLNSNTPNTGPSGSKRTSSTKPQYPVPFQKKSSMTLRIPVIILQRKTRIIHKRKQNQHPPAPPESLSTKYLMNDGPFSSKPIPGSVTNTNDNIINIPDTLVHQEVNHTDSKTQVTRKKLPCTLTFSILWIIGIILGTIFLFFSDALYPSTISTVSTPSSLPPVPQTGIIYDIDLDIPGDSFLGNTNNIMDSLLLSFSNLIPEGNFSIVNVKTNITTKSTNVTTLINYRTVQYALNSTISLSRRLQQSSVSLSNSTECVSIRNETTYKIYNTKVSIFVHCTNMLCINTTYTKLLELQNITAYYANQMEVYFQTFISNYAGCTGNNITIPETVTISVEDIPVVVIIPSTTPTPSPSGIVMPSPTSTPTSTSTSTPTTSTTSSVSASASKQPQTGIIYDIDLDIPGDSFMNNTNNIMDSLLLSFSNLIPEGNISTVNIKTNITTKRTNVTTLINYRTVQYAASGVARRLQQSSSSSLANTSECVSIRNESMYNIYNTKVSIFVQCGNLFCLYSAYSKLLMLQNITAYYTNQWEVYFQTFVSNFAGCTGNNISLPDSVSIPPTEPIVVIIPSSSPTPTSTPSTTSTSSSSATSNTSVSSTSTPSPSAEPQTGIIYDIDLDIPGDSLMNNTNNMMDLLLSSFSNIFPDGNISAVNIKTNGTTISTNITTVFNYRTVQYAANSSISLSRRLQQSSSSSLSNTTECITIRNESMYNIYNTKVSIFVQCRTMLCINTTYTKLLELQNITAYYTNQWEVYFQSFVNSYEECTGLNISIPDSVSIPPDTPPVVVILPSNSPSSSPSSSSTSTPSPSSTSTSTPTPTSSSTPSATKTSTPTSSTTPSPTPSSTASASATAQPQTGIIYDIDLDIPGDSLMNNTNNMMDLLLSSFSNIFPDGNISAVNIKTNGTTISTNITTVFNYRTVQYAANSSISLSRRLQQSSSSSLSNTTECITIRNESMYNIYNTKVSIFVQCRTMLCINTTYTKLSELQNITAYYTNQWEVYFQSFVNSYEECTGLNISIPDSVSIPPDTPPVVVILPSNSPTPSPSASASASVTPSISITPTQLPVCIPLNFNYTINPCNVSSQECSLWLDASDCPTLSIQPGVKIVNQWNDKSSNNQVVSFVGTIKYTTNIRSVNTDAATNSYFFTNLDLRKSIFPNASVFLVYTFTGYNLGGFHALWGQDIGGGWNRFQILSFVPPLNYGFSYTPYSPWVTNVNNMDNGNINIYAATFAYLIPQGTSVHINGALSSAEVQEDVSPAETVSTDTLFGTIDTGFSGSVSFHEILIYRFELTVVERQTIEGYLAWKWSIQNSLPSDHPYKNSSP